MDLSLARRVEPELLDGLAAEDPRAPLEGRFAAYPPGDGDDSHRGTHPGSRRGRIRSEKGARTWRRRRTLTLHLAQKRAARWPNVHVALLDRLNLVTPPTLNGFRFMRPVSTRIAATLPEHFPQLLTEGARWTGKAAPLRGTRSFERATS
jgi:hypothetical protein